MSVQLERQLTLIALLADSRQGLSRQAVFRRLRNFYPSETPKQAVASEKIFVRDLDALAGMGIPILTLQKENESRYRLSETGEGLPDDFILSPFEAADLRGLLDDAVVRQQLPAPCLRILSNLLAFHAPFDREGQGEAREGDVLDARLSRLLAMSKSGSAARISYPSRAGASETRVVSPIGGWLHRGLPYVVAMCHRDRVPKTFAVEKIGRLEVSEEAWQVPPEGFNLKEYSGRNAFHLEVELGLKKVEIRVSAEESWRLKERAPWSVTQDYPDGAVRAEFEISSTRRFFRMVLGYGAYAEIIGPPEIRAEFAAFLKSCL